MRPASEMSTPTSISSWAVLTTESAPPRACRISEMMSTIIKKMDMKRGLTREIDGSINFILALHVNQVQITPL